MTTTSTYSGIENMSNKATRVLNPPGGKASFTLGGGEEQAPKEVQKTTPEDIDTEKQDQQEEQDDSTKQLSAQTTKPAAHNPVTGEPSAQGASDPSPTRGRAKPERLDPASLPAAGGRVENRTPMKRQPPGGKDSGIFS